MDISRLNINNGGVPVKGFTGSDSHFEELSKRIGAPIPEEYIAFIKTANGGHPEISEFRKQGEQNEENFFGVNRFYSIGNPSNIESVEATLTTWGKILGDKCLPIANDGGNNQIYLKLSDRPASVWMCLFDEGLEGIHFKVSSSFEVFLDSLFQHPDLV